MFRNAFLLSWLRYTLSMKHQGQKRSLESYKIFPYVAWTTSILFAFFVYNIAMELQTVADQLQAQAESLETKANMAPEAIVDFES